MTTQELRAALQGKPFRPFMIHMADGRAFEVRHPDFLIVAPNHRTAFVYSPDGRELSIIDVMLMTEIEFIPQDGQPPAGSTSEPS